MWPEALPSFAIIAGALVFAGAGLHFLNRLERGGKVGSRIFRGETTNHNYTMCSSFVFFHGAE